VGQDGKPGPAVYKNSGQLRGTVKDIAHDAKTGTETITIQDQRGKLQQISFREQTVPYESADPHTGQWPDHPVKTLTSEVKPGDDITLKFDPRSQTATIENRTQAMERTVNPQGQVQNERSVDFKQQQRESPALERVRQ
jgi:hypothetical protein